MNWIDPSRRQTNETNNVEKVKEHVRYGLALAEIPKRRTNMRRNFDVLDRLHLFNFRVWRCDRCTKSKPVFFYGQKRWHFFDPLTISIFGLLQSCCTAAYKIFEYTVSCKNFRSTTRCVISKAFVQYVFKNGQIFP